MYCPNCKTEVNTSVRMIRETYPVKGEEITIEAHVRFCDSCGCDIWDQALDGENLLKAYEEYRNRHNLLQPTEIRSIRKKYRLTQEAFAKALGLKEKTITRCENGSILEQPENNLILLANNPDNFALLLEKNKGALSQEEYEAARTALYHINHNQDQPACRTISVSDWDKFHKELISGLEPHDTYAQGYTDALDRVDDWLDAQRTMSYDHWTAIDASYCVGSTTAPIL